MFGDSFQLVVLDLSKNEVESVLIVDIVEVVNEVARNRFLSVIYLACSSSLASPRKVDFQCSCSRIEKTDSVGIIAPKFSE